MVSTWRPTARRGTPATRRQAAAQLTTKRSYRGQVTERIIRRSFNRTTKGSILVLQCIRSRSGVCPWSRRLVVGDKEAWRIGDSGVILSPTLPLFLIIH